ncbi:MAG: hypothetical protein V4635_12835 [Bacteroidota bacterium]
MKYLLPTVLIAAGTIFLNSCTTQMYVSNAVNAPLLKERGEVQLAVTQNDLQAAIGIGRHFGIMANGFYKNYRDDNNYRHSGVLGEVGLGYYEPMEHNLVFETFAGAGVGNVYKQQQFTNTDNTTYIGKFNADATKVFVQPDFGYKSGIFDLILSSRFSVVKYKNFQSENYPQQELKKDYLDNNNLVGPTFIFAEPALTVRLGYKYVKVQAQVGLTANLTGHNIKHPDNFSSVGIVIDIARWYNN